MPRAIEIRRRRVPFDVTADFGHDVSRTATAMNFRNDPTFLTSAVDLRIQLGRLQLDEQATGGGRNVVLDGAVLGHRLSERYVGKYPVRKDVFLPSDLYDEMEARRASLGEDRRTFMTKSGALAVELFTQIKGNSDRFADWEQDTVVRGIVVGANAYDISARY